MTKSETKPFEKDFFHCYKIKHRIVGDLNYQISPLCSGSRGGKIRQITMPLRPRKKQTFAIEWESSLNSEGRFSFVWIKDKKIIGFSHGKVTFGLCSKTE